MKLALCNAVLKDFPFSRQCEYAASLGYDGIELVPATLGESPGLPTSQQRAEFRRAASNAGIVIVGMHRLLPGPMGFSITSDNDQVRASTLEFLKALVELCGDLGGHIMVHGSPGQRRVPSNSNHEDAWMRARDVFAAVGEHAAAHGVTYCVEPLPKDETDFINTLEAAGAMIDEVNCTALRTIVDAKSVFLGEQSTLPEIIDRWMPTGKIAHVHFNSENRRGPGQGSEVFSPAIAALIRNRYEGFITVEPFIFEPDAPATAAFSAGYLRGILEGLSSDAGQRR